MGKNEFQITDRQTAKTYLFFAVIYTVIIFGFWMIYVLTLYPIIADIKLILARIFFNEFIRALIFVVPVFLIIKFGYGKTPLSYLKLNENFRSGILWGIAAGFLYVLFAVGRILLTGGDIILKPPPLEAWLTSISVATIIEEISFRGFLLQSFGHVMKFWKANLLTAVLFAGIHLPGWIILSGASVLPNKLTAMAEILILGLLLGVLLKKSGSLWACVILHATNNLLSTSLFG